MKKHKAIPNIYDSTSKKFTSWHSEIEDVYGVIIILDNTWTKLAEDRSLGGIVDGIERAINNEEA